MKIKALISLALLTSISATAGHFSWGISLGFGGGYCAPVYCPPPVVYVPVVYSQPVVVAPPTVVYTSVVYSPQVVVMPQPVVYYPQPIVYVVGRHGHRR